MSAQRLRHRGGQQGLLVAGLWLLTAVATTGCSAREVNLSAHHPPFQPAEYQEVYETWTRQLKLVSLDGIQNVLSCDATYRSHEFRWAYSIRMASDFKLSPEERKSLSAEQYREMNNGHEFFVTVMSGVKQANVLEMEEGPWVIRLEDDRGRSVRPLLVEHIKKPSLTEIKYFHFDPVHRKAYRILFPLAAPDGTPMLTPSTRFFVLSFSSALGQGTLRWETIAAPEN